MFQKWISIIFLLQNFCLLGFSLEGVQFMLYTNENENGLDITTSNHDDFKK